MKLRHHVLVVFVGLLSSSSSADILNVRSELGQKLQSFGKFAVAGVWQGNSCALTGMAPPEYLIVVNETGILKNGIEVRGPQTTLGTGALGSDDKTFVNCSDSPSAAQATFQANVSKTASVTMTHGMTSTISGSLTLTAGAPGQASAALGISGQKQWSTSTSETQTTQLSVTQGNNFSTSVPAHMEQDISYVVFSNRIRLPVTATGIFDGGFYQCQQVPSGATKVSDLLPEAERTFTATGYLDFDSAQTGRFVVGQARPTTCGRSPRNLLSRNARVPNRTFVIQRSQKRSVWNRGRYIRSYYQETRNGTR